MNESTGGEMPMALDAGNTTSQNVTRANPALQTATDPSKRSAAHLNAEHWRRAGIELVTRRGSPQEIAEMRARLAEVLAIQRETEKWLAQRQREAA